MGYKLCKFRENRAKDMPLWGIYVPNFGKLLVKISLLGSYTHIIAPMGWNLTCRSTPPCQTSPHWCKVSPLRGKQPHNQPLSNLYAGTLLLVIICGLSSATITSGLAW